MKKVMYCVSQRMPDPHDGSKCIRPDTEMCDLAQELHAMPLGLQRILFGISITNHFDMGCFYLNILTLALRSKQCTLCDNSRTCGDPLEQCRISIFMVYHHLDGLDT